MLGSSSQNFIDESDSRKTTNKAKVYIKKKEGKKKLNNPLHFDQNKSIKPTVFLFLAAHDYYDEPTFWINRRSSSQRFMIAKRRHGRQWTRSHFLRKSAAFAIYVDPRCLCEPLRGNRTTSYFLYMSCRAMIIVNFRISR